MRGRGHRRGGGPGTGWAAVLTDGSALRDNRSAGNRVMHELARHLGELAHVPVRPVTLDAAGATRLADGVRALPADAGAVLLTHTDPVLTRAAQDELRASGARPLVTEEDATAIALTAALLGAVAGHGRRPEDSRHGRVVVAGARELPILTPLLVAAGFADITLWNSADATGFPLRSVVSGAYAVVDLTGSARACHDPGTTVITRGDAHAAPCAAAALLRAALHTPGATFDVEAYHACAVALAAPSSGRPVPPGTAQALTRRAADAVAHVFRTRQNTF